MGTEGRLPVVLAFVMRAYFLVIGDQSPVNGGGEEWAQPTAGLSPRGR
jgi:hypothetical protein